MTYGRIVGMSVLATAVLVGCHRVPPPATVDDVRSAICTFWRDDGDKAHLMGGGVFLGMNDAGQRRMFCLTARHVATIPPGDGSMGGFFLHPDRMLMSLENQQGSVTWKHGIAPERWMTGGLEYDLAWFELTMDEIRHVEAVGCLPIAVSTNMTATAVDMLRMSDGGDVVSGAAAISEDAMKKAGLTNDVSMLAFVGASRDCKKILGGPCPSSVTNVCVKLKQVNLKRILLDFDGHKELKGMGTRQIIIRLKTDNGDSGMPVFVFGETAAHPMLVGVFSARKNQQPFSGVMPIDDALRNMLGANARRLLELKYLQ